MIKMTQEKMVEINESIEIEARVNFLQCAPQEFAKPFRQEIRRIGSIYVTMIPEIDNPIHNQILGLGIYEPATESLLDEAIAIFQQAGCNRYRTPLSPYAKPAELSKWLLERGFKPGRKWAKIYRGNEPLLPTSTDLRIEKIGKDQAEAFADVILPVWGLKPAYRPLVKGFVGKPGWYHYLAFEGSKPVSTVCMFIKGENAWLGWASTLKQYRNRGGQSAIMAHLIEEGLAMGCKWYIGETEEDTPEHPVPSYHNVLRMGFKLAYLRRNYTRRLPESPIRRMSRALYMAVYGLRITLR